MTVANLACGSPTYPEVEVMPGVAYGRPEWVPSPAYWVARAQQEGPNADAYISPPGTPLIDDIAFCLLGGYGIKMEINRAAWERLKAEGIWNVGSKATAIEVEKSLERPLSVDGRLVRYRFPRQRAERLVVAIQWVESRTFESTDALGFRQALMELPGIGPKTASWIVRNWTGSDDVAILDVHVIRAGRLIGLFPENIRLPKDYDVLEQLFLQFARALEIRPSLLDALIWRDMRQLTR